MQSSPSPPLPSIIYYFRVQQKGRDLVSYVKIYGTRSYVDPFTDTLFRKYKVSVR
jgi:hypothetical protein